jgi:hypothetical protein
VADRDRLLDPLRLAVIVVGYGTLAVAAVVLALVSWGPGELPTGIPMVWIGVPMLAVVLVGGLAAHRQIRDVLGARLRPVADFLVLVVLVPWGLFCNAAARAGMSPRGKAFLIYGPFAVPEVAGLIGLHALAVLAYAVCRRRPRPFSGVGEPLVQGFLIAGVILHALVAVQLRGLLLLGFVPPFLPCAVPLLTILFYLEELASRRRGGRSLAPAIGLSLLLLGGWAVAQKALLGWTPLQAFTRTFGHPLSKLPSAVNPDLDRAD